MIYLASRSPRRQEILAKMKIPFRVVPSRYREEHLPGVEPEKLVLWHACQKARGARVPRNGRFVLGADTLVFLGDRILGKPKDKKQARRMLVMLSGKAHKVITGVSLLDRKTHSIFTGFEKTKVYFRRLSARDIRDYLARVKTLDKAGAYAIQEGHEIIRRIEGSWSNVVGLPIKLVKQMLKEAYAQKL